MTKPEARRSRMGTWAAILLLSASAAGAEAERGLPAGVDYGAGLRRRAAGWCSPTASP
jgi:hypothetical protein